MTNTSADRVFPGDHPVEILTSADGEPVALHDFGGRGPNLVFGHGNGLNAGMWAAIVPLLADRFHCHGIDLRGHGRCRPVDAAYSVERDRFGQDVIACIEALGAEPTHYVGHSLGGAAALFGALQRPELFRSMWLFEPVVVPDTFDLPAGGPAHLITGSRKRRMDFPSIDDAAERFLSKPPFSGCDPLAVRAYVDVGSYPSNGGIRLSCEGENEARVYESGETVDFARLGQLMMPTVVAVGRVTEDAHAIPSQVAPLVAAALGNGRLERHDELTHFGPMEAPRHLAASIARHLESVRAEG
jgi:pimeloyl-ACP methyl ester carboxylesterase